jgi:hypothetical protein
VRLLRQGTWWTTSSDKRWCGSGTAQVGGFQMPPECQTWIDATKAKLGEDPPEDLEWHYMKD